MKPRIRVSSIALIPGLLLFACATTPTGRVTMPLGETSAHATTDGMAVNVGDSVRIFEKRCIRHGCTRTEKGLGKVTERINDDYVVLELLQPEQGRKIAEGDLFEKVK